MKELFKNDKLKSDYRRYYKNKPAKTILRLVEIMKNYPRYPKWLRVQSKKNNIKEFIAEYSAKDAPDGKNKIYGKEEYLAVNKFFSFVYIFLQIT